MSISKLYTLEKLLTEGIEITELTEDNKHIANLHKIAGILIPRIQRPYAQGRRNKNVSDIRHDFVENLLSVLSSPEARTLELSFTFGSLQRVKWNGPSSEAFELLDGQQRLTTLFLLHWYLYRKEGVEDFPEWLSHFRYETRDTSTEFLAKITDKECDIDLNEKVLDKDKNGTPISKVITPSEAITRLIWYSNDFRCDTTVTSMLTMLDEIDTQYKVLENRAQTLDIKLHLNLNRIQFYVRFLLDFDMADLLFIKMNSRGLPLTPFENFKADAIKYMEKAKTYNEIVETDGQIQPFSFYFASRIDTRWIYLFWERPNIPDKGKTIELHDKRTGARFFRFFNRMLYTKLAIDYAEQDDPSEKEKLEKASVFFRTVSEVSMDDHLTDWSTRYLPMISRWSGDDDYFRGCAKVLEVLSRNYTSGINIREEIRKTPYTSSADFEIYSKVADAKGSFTLTHRVILSAIIDFILLMPEGDGFENPVVAENFKKLIRTLHNVLEHTEIDNKNILDVIKAIHGILKVKGAITEDFYLALDKYDGEFRWIKAEASKANDILNDSNFESVMIRGEVHPILRGRLTPFYVPGELSIVDLAKRVDMFYRIFPVDNGICKGIAPEYAKSESHLLIRGLMSYLTDWDMLDGTYVTERGYIGQEDDASNSKHLSNLLFGKGKCEQLFQTYFSDRFDNNTRPDATTDILDTLLKERIEEAKSFEIKDDGTWDVYKRLVTDEDSTKIYKWIISRENARPYKEPVIRWLRDAGILNYDNTNCDRLVLTTPRRYVIPDVINLTGAEYDDKNQERHPERFGEYYAYDVIIKKVVRTYTIKVIFYPNNWCRIQVDSKDKDLQGLLNSHKDKAKFYLDFEYNKEDSVQTIAKKINEWSSVLAEV